MKQLLNVARMGNPILRRKAEEVAPARIEEPEFQDFLDSMILTMHEYEGVGLAAPQVHQSLRVVVLHEEAGIVEEGEEPLTVLINPRITPLTQERSSMWEGCLSVPGLRGKVSRPNRVRLAALDRTGKRIDLELKGFAAIVIQHECDHLDGVLFLDRIEDRRELAFEREFERYFRPELEAELDETAEEEEAS
jgi:peptide deformylase